MQLSEYLNKTGESQAAFGSRLAGFGPGLTVSQPAVGHWLAGRERVRAELVLAVAQATAWAVTPHELRPDLYPHPSDGMPKPLTLTGFPEESAVGAGSG